MAEARRLVHTEGEKRTMIVWEVWAQESLETQENKVESAIAWEVIWENLAYQLQRKGEEKQIIIIWENFERKQGAFQELQGLTELQGFILLQGIIFQDMPHRENLIRKIVTMLAYFIKFLRMPMRPLRHTCALASVWRSQRPRL